LSVLQTVRTPSDSSSSKLSVLVLVAIIVGSIVGGCVICFISCACCMEIQDDRPSTVAMTSVKIQPHIPPHQPDHVGPSPPIKPLRSPGRPMRIRPLDQRIKPGSPLDVCSICLKDLPEDLSPGFQWNGTVARHHRITLTACGHPFHTRCLKQWAKANSSEICPICQTAVDPTSWGGSRYKVVPWDDMRHQRFMAERYRTIDTSLDPLIILALALNASQQCHSNHHHHDNHESNYHHSGGDSYTGGSYDTTTSASMDFGGGSSFDGGGGGGDW
jgi:hypothetical protein